MKRLIPLLVFLAYSIALQAQTDVPGSKEHPVVSRFKGSYIRFYEEKKFDQYKLRISPIKTESDPAAKYTTLQGKVTRIVYQCPKTVGAYELYQSYAQALLQNGFTKLFGCENDACGTGFGKSYPSDNAPHIRSYKQDQRYFAGKRKESDTSDLYVALYAVFTQDGPVARLEVVETRRMEANQVTVTAAKIKTDIDNLGKAIIDQVYFESGKAVLLPTSAPALAQVGKMLMDNPSLKIFVVGHTDNESGFEFNMTLSQRRAEAVVNELITKHGIAAARLTAKGVGYLCPVATNESPAGRAKNRRVELVKQ